MKPSRFAVLAAILLVLPAPDSKAQISLFWDTQPGSSGVQGGTGNWLGTNFWNNVFNNVAWNDGANAAFLGTPGTVTVNGAVSANGLAFSVDGYVIGGTSFLTLGGATPTITVTNAGQTGTINAPLGGTAGLIKAGNGTLVLGGTTSSSSYVGPTTINAGAITIASGGGCLPSNSAVSIANVAGAALNVSVGAESLGSLSGGGTTGGSVSVEAGSFLDVGQDNTSTTFGGIVNAAGTFKKIGTGTLTLTNTANTFLQGINISSGALAVPVLSRSSGDPLGATPSIRLGGTLIYTGSATVSDDVDLVCEGGGIDVAAVAQLSITGNFTGTGGFTKSGPGILVLGGTGTYAGSTTVAGGRLSLSNGNPIPSSSTITLADVAGVLLQVNSQPIGALAGGGANGGSVLLTGTVAAKIGANDASTTFAGTIVGSGDSITKIGTGVLTLTGFNTYSAVTAVTNGTLRVGGGNAIPNNSTVNVSASGGATLDLDGSNETIGSLTGGGMVTLGSGTLTVQSLSATTFSGMISGSGGFTKAGSFPLTLTGTNIYTGPTTINAGTLRLGSGSALTDLAAVTLANAMGATLDLNNFSKTIGSLSGGGTTGGDVTLGNGTLTVGANQASTSYGGIISGVGGSIVKVGAGTLTFTFIHTFTGDLSIQQGAISVAAVTNSGTNGLLGAGTTLVLGGPGTTGTLIFTSTGADSTNRALNLNGGGGAIAVSDANGSLTLSGSATGGGGLTKLGAGTLLLSGNNTYSGPTLVTGGKLQASGGDAIGDNSALTLSNVTGAVLELLNSSETVGSLAGGGANGGNVMLGTGSLTAGDDNSSTIYAGAISGGGGVTKTGSGMMTFTGANSYTGVTTINAGTLRVGGGSAIADSSGVILATGALLDLNNSSEAIGSLAGNGNVTLGNGTLTVGGNNNSTTLNGTISGTAGSLIKTGSGVFTLLGASNYTGATTVSAGTLALADGLGTPGAALNIAAGATLQVRNVLNRPISGTGTIQVSGALYIGAADSNNGFNFDGSFNVGGNLAVLLDADSATLGSSTTLGANGRLDAPNGLTLGASRTLSAAANATVNANFVNQGTVNGPASGGQFLTFTEDVSGAGNYTGNVLFSDGFSPGSSPALISLENFAFDSTTTLSIELGGISPGNEYDRLNFSGNGLLHGTLSVGLINGYIPQGGHVFTIIAGGTLSGAFDAMILPPLGPGLTWLYSQNANAAQLTVVPEPRSAALLILSAGALLGLRQPGGRCAKHLRCVDSA